MNILKIFLSFVITMNSCQAFAGSKESAQIAIQQSHVAARSLSESFLKEDLQKLIGEITQTAIKKIDPNAHPIPAKIEELNHKVVSQLDRNFSIEKMDLRDLTEIVENYRALVRERFRASFEVQDLVYNRGLTVRSFEMAFEGFETLCKTGRSAVGSIKEPASIPNIPKNEYSFSFYFGDKGGQSSANSSASSPSEDSKNRNNVGAALGVATGVTTSIALSGAAGATTAMAMAAAPYLAAAFVLYSLVNYAITNDEGIALQNEHAQAQVDIFSKSANDRDVARYYQETCQKAAATLSPLRQDIHDFFYSDVRRLEIQQKIDQTLTARQKYFDEAAALSKSRQLVDAMNTKVQECLKTKPVADCKPNEQEHKNLKSALEEIQKFDSIYPQETALMYQTHNLIELLYIQWQDFSTVIQNSSFAEVDRVMNILARRLQVLIVEIQKARNSNWAKSHKLLGTEEKLQEEFFALRKEYFAMISQALKIYFNKADAKKGKEQFKQFAKRFNTFAGKTIISPEVQTMNQSVKAIGAFYESL